MKKSEIQVGGHYTAKVSGKLTTVRVDGIREVYDHKDKLSHRYEVTNLATGRKTTFRSAAKFRGPAAPFARSAAGKPVAGLTPSAPTTAEPCTPSESSQPTTTAVKGRCKKCGAAVQAQGNLILGHRRPANAEFNACGYCAAVIAKYWFEEGVAGVEEDEHSDPFEAGTASTAAPLPAESPAQSAVATPAVPARSVECNTATAPVPTNGFLAAALAAEGYRPEAQPAVPQTFAGMTPTEEQWAIIEAARAAGLKTLVIGAGAGTGKTSTLKMLEQVLTGRGQYTAFNSNLVAESKAKFKRASCNTTHSLAFRAVGRRYAHRLGGPRVKSWQVARALGIDHFPLPLPEGAEEGTRPKILSAEFLAGQVLVAIRRFCQSADRGLTSEHFRYIDGIDQPTPEGKRGYDNNRAVREYLLPFAQKAWADLSDPQGSLPFSHDHYVKIWQLGQGADRPFISADYILLDEAQDTAPVFLDILQQQTHALLILVGDDNQQIYEWRGAVNAMASFPGAPRRLLSQSFRFGQRIADVANSILATLDDPTDLVMRGLPSIPSRVAAVSDPRCVLCRTNACAVGTVLKAIEEGKRPHLIGGGADVVAFVKAAMQLQAKQPTSHPELACFADWDEVVKYAETDEGEDLKLMVKLIKEFGCEEILRALENMPDEDDADLVVSTAHKSKGREWDTVRLAGDFPEAHKMSDADRRLLYVAVTRAKLVLDIEECPPFQPAYDKETGREIEGICIRFTREQPVEDEFISYPTERRSMQALPPAVEESRSSDNLPKPEANGKTVEQFTWSNLDGRWYVRGPALHECKTVNVVKKSGDVRRVELAKAVKKFGDVWVYQTA